MALKRSELIEGLGKLAGLSGLDFAPLIDRLTLPQRATWLEIPSGFSRRDTDLSKFDRRLSIIARPIVWLSRGDDPVLAVAPAVIERALVHNIGGAIQGTLQNDFWVSREMLSYAGSAGSRIGIEFNEKLARRLRSMGLDARPSAKPSALLNEKNSDELKRLGDIDVLAIDRSNGVVWVCEAKDLKLCRTLGETAQRLSEYRGQIVDGKPDKLLRHLQRVNYLRGNAARLGRQLKLGSPPKVCGALIVNSPQPMQQLTVEYFQDSTVVMFDNVESIPWGKGW